MKEKNALQPGEKPSLKRADVFFLSLGGVGFSPFAPGTAATLVSLPVFYTLSQAHAPFFFFIPFLLITTVAACFIAHHVQIELCVQDPSWIVIDEFLGLGVSWLFLISTHWSHFLFVALLFRVYDIVKVWPANYIDKKVKNGAGTILDDIVSGLYAGLTYLIFTHFFI